MKAYYSKHGLSLNLNIEGKRYFIDFWDVSGGGSRFVTGDEQIQEALEKHPSFNLKFLLEEEIKPTPKAGRTLEEVSVKRCAEAKIFLIEKGHKGVGLVSKSEIIAQGELMGYSFPNL